MKPLEAPCGEVTTAAYLFTKLLDALAKQKPDYLILAWDGPRTELIRRKMYPAYKANRGSSEETHAQVKMCHKIATKMGLPPIQVKGYEADDVIAAYAKKICKKHDDIIVDIYTSDKDLAQLMTLGENVYMCDAATKQARPKSHYENNFGVKIDQLRDYLALVGDKSDNVPGAPGIGPVTAVNLLKRYGTIENIDLSEQTKKVVGALTSDELELSRELVTLFHVKKKRLTPLRDLTFSGLDWENTKPYLRKLGFTQW